jgi:hypothetical protein
MKILKLIAIVALVGYGSSVLALPNPFNQKLDRKEVDMIKARAEKAQTDQDFKHVEADIQKLKKHGNIKAAGHTQATLTRRKAELAVQEAAAAQKSQAELAAKQAALAKAQEAEKQKLVAEVIADKEKVAAAPEAEMQTSEAMTEEDKAQAADQLNRAQSASTPEEKLQVWKELDNEYEAIDDEYRDAFKKSVPGQQQSLKQRYEARKNAVNEAKALLGVTLGRAPASTNKPQTKNEQLSAQLRQLDVDLNEMSKKQKNGEISQEEFDQYVDDNTKSRTEILSQFTIEIR